MKFSITLIFSFFFLTTSSAQSKWSVGVISGLDVSAIKYERFEFRDQNGDLIDLDNEYPLLQYRYGIDLGYELNDRMIVKSGIRINGQGDETRLDDLRWGSQHDGQGGFDPSIDPDAPSNFKSSRRSYFLEVPIHVKYTLGSSSWNLFFEGGVSPNIFLKRRAVSVFEGREELTESSNDVHPDFRKFTASVDLGFGVQKSISDKLNINFQPMARYYFVPVYKKSDVTTVRNFYNFGVEMGLTYHLK